MEKMPERNQKKIGPLLWQLCVARKITQTVIAERTGISRIAVNRFFRGKSDVRASDLAAILLEMRIPLETIIKAHLEGERNGTIFT